MRKVFLFIAAVSLSMTMMAEKTWVDLGLPSGALWASEPEKGYYTYTEAVEQFRPNLPTKWQWNELLESCLMDKNANGDIVLTGKNGATLIIPTLGYIYKDGKVQDTDKGHYHAFNNFDRKYAWNVTIYFPNQGDFLTWTFKDTHHMSVLLVNK